MPVKAKRKLGAFAATWAVAMLAAVAMEGVLEDF
jgi:hypothetical protein